MNYSGLPPRQSMPTGPILPLDDGRYLVEPRSCRGGGFVGRLVCRITDTHNWYALNYPPAGRWECERCGALHEDRYDHDVLEER